MELNYLFRISKYPIICDFDGYVVGAKKKLSFIRSLIEINFEKLDEEKFYDVIDSKGKSWKFTTKHMTISPLSFKKKWPKNDVIRMYNERKNQIFKDKKFYSEKSISAKRFDRIIKEIVELLNPIK